MANVGVAMRSLGIETIAATPVGPAKDYFLAAGLEHVSFDFNACGSRRLSSARFGGRRVFCPRPEGSRRFFERSVSTSCIATPLMTIVGPVAARMSGAKVVWHMNDTQLPAPIYRAGSARDARFG